MIAIGVRYLSGRSVAGNPSQRQEPEWPPHPARLFMALAAAHFETAEPDPAERRALQWLEGQEQPTIVAHHQVQPRSYVETFVPVNDQAGTILARPRQPRAFASAYVGDEPVIFQWQAEPDVEVRSALGNLCSRVTRIGHSSSLVQSWLAEGTGAAGWKPVEFAAAARPMRVATNGTLGYLESAYGNERPKIARWQPYLAPEAGASGSDASALGPFEPDLVVFTKMEGQPLGLETTLQLTSALRNAAMNASQGPVPEWLSGHGEDRGPSRGPHAAFFPLPFVGGERGDGHVLGLAMAIPRQLTQESLRPILAPLLFTESGTPREVDLWCGTPPGASKSRVFWRWKLRRETRDFPPLALRAETWTGPATLWASVTPVVLHHYPKPKREGDVERIVRAAFASALLPEPEEVRVRPVSVFAGAGHARSMPEYDEGGEKLCRYQTHVRVRFKQSVRGPVLAGRGRFRGYGLFRPLGGGE
ncbi:MAG TPA: type I-U CRISPR-associated protein Csb2 [Terriglobales bacterium]|nr:type I-U CRISPR-associated protein Csb2 [Terriglobales bacterium]